VAEYHYPTKEEIRVGWEGEINWNLGYEDTYTPITILYPDAEARDGWNCNIDDVLSLAIWDRCAEIRCPFLSEEQIVAEGWTKYLKNGFYREHPRVVKRDGEYFLDDMLVVSGHYDLSYRPYDKQLFIYNLDGERLFCGKCPDINTFRTICKLVGV